MGIYFIAALFFALVGGRSSPAMATVTGIVSPQYRGAYISLVNSFQQLALAVSSFLAGIVVKKSPQTQYLEGFSTVGNLAIVFSIISILISYQVHKVMNTQVHRN